MKREYGVSTVSDVPTGVDTDFFRPKEYTERTNNIVFTGSMDWLPNEDAIRWFVDVIFPLIRYKVPDAVLTVVGRNPAASLQELASADSGVVVTGRVPDVRPYMNKASVYVVPIRIGGGTRLKVYEAMAMGLPIVSTTIGAEGLSVKDGENILLRDDPEAFAKAVVHLLADAKAASAIGKASAQHVFENFSWAEVARAFTRQCENVIENTERVEVPLNT
jgi:glycosyltransferase involved in cell wall biosynthesis